MMIRIYCVNETLNKEGNKNAKGNSQTQQMRSGIIHVHVCLKIKCGKTKSGPG